MSPGSLFVCARLIRDSSLRLLCPSPNPSAYICHCQCAQRMTSVGCLGKGASPWPGRAHLNILTMLKVHMPSAAFHPQKRSI